MGKDNKDDEFKGIIELIQTEPFTDRTYNIRSKLYAAAFVAIILQDYSGKISNFIVKFDPSISSHSLWVIAITIASYKFMMYIFYGYNEYQNWKTNYKNELFNLKKKPLDLYSHFSDEYLNIINNIKKVEDYMKSNQQKIDSITESQIAENLLINKINASSLCTKERILKENSTILSTRPDIGIDLLQICNTFKNSNIMLQKSLTNMTQERNNINQLGDSLDRLLNSIKYRVNFKIFVVDFTFPCIVFVVAICKIKLGLIS